MTSPDHLSREPFTVAAVRFNPEMFEFDHKVDAACMAIEEAAGNGARIIVLPELEPEAGANHSTDAAVQQLSEWNGMAMIAADRNNAESNPTTGVTVVYGGASSIWQADGRRTAHSPATNANMTAANKGTIRYETTDTAESAVNHEVTAHTLRYRVVPDDVDRDITRANSPVEELCDQGGEGVLVVLPACGFSGMPDRAEEAERPSESELGRTTQALCDFAGRLRSPVVGCHVERDSEDPASNSSWTRPRTKRTTAPSARRPTSPTSRSRRARSACR
jgi:hypothetical protein